MVWNSLASTSFKLEVEVRITSMTTSSIVVFSKQRLTGVKMSRSQTADPSKYSEPKPSTGGKKPATVNEAWRASIRLSSVSSSFSKPLNFPVRTSVIPMSTSLLRDGISANSERRNSSMGSLL